MSSRPSKGALYLVVSVLIGVAVVGARPDGTRFECERRLARRGGGPSWPRGAGPAPAGASQVGAEPGRHHSSGLSNHSAPLSQTVTGFWHIGAANVRGEGESKNAARSALVRRQLEELRAFPALREIPIRFLVEGEAIDSPTLGVLQAQSNLRQLSVPEEMQTSELPTSRRDGRQAMYEFPTLMRLWEHCQATPNGIVFYIHSKSDQVKRQAYQADLFADPVGTVERLSAPGGLWVYTATRCRRWPWCHSTGNFWWATCQHVRRLNNPFRLQFLRQAAASTLSRAGQSMLNPPTGRFRAEYWLLSDFANEADEPPLRCRVRLDWCQHQTYGDICQYVGAPVRDA